MKTFVLLSEKSWHESLVTFLSNKFANYKWVWLNKKEDFTLNNLEVLNPEKIFIPHWSYIIPESIYQKYDCIVFHMTDLPYGRGGSPLQNLIVRGNKETKISALKVSAGLDTGPVYLKKPLSLFGTAQEIFLRTKDLVQNMIVEIIDRNLIPKEQVGEITKFERRKPKDGNIENLENVFQVYDYIRMLDCEGYPPAFVETDKFRFEFSRASLKSEKEIIADVRIIKK